MYQQAKPNIPGAVEEGARHHIRLAIGAPSFCIPSETFIRDHVRNIAPGETILICDDDRGAERFGCPVLSHIDARSTPRTRLERVANAVRRRWRTYVDPGLGAADRRRVRSFFRSYEPRAVLAEYGPVGCLLARACHEAKEPLYVHFHGYDASVLLQDWRWVRRYRKLFCGAAGIIVPSKFLARNLAAIGCSETKLHVSPFGIDPDRFAPGKSVPQRIIAVGRLVEKKAPHLTIAAFGKIAARYPQARLDMIGDGPLASRCRALIGELGLGEQVRLLGIRGSDSVAKLMSQASLFVQHSVIAENGDMEGFPVAILEAMGSALPVVSTRHSGIPEAVEECVTGLLVDEHDVEGMAGAMSTLLHDTERAAKMGLAGRKRLLAHYTHVQARDRLRAIMGFAAL
jgi:colanic acid/amylovoran biosynthesis glycosyltransferase